MSALYFLMTAPIALGITFNGRQQYHSNSTRCSYESGRSDPIGDNNVDVNSDSADGNADNVWKVCWSSQTAFEDLESLTGKMGQCVKHQMYLDLVKNVDKPCVDIGDGVKYYSPDDTVLAPRDIFPLGEEPSTYRGLMDAYSTYLSRRGLEWDLSHLYPGLMMMVGPTLNADGVLHFATRPLQPHQRTKFGPGHELVRRALLPRLLGFRMNIMTLLPLLFGILVYVAKNAFIFSKLTLIISTLLALKSLFFLQHLPPPNHHGPYHVHDITDPAESSQQHVLGGGSLGPGHFSHGHHPHEGLGHHGHGHRPQDGPAHHGHGRPQDALSPEFVLQMFSSAIPPFRGVNDQIHGAPDHGERNFSWE